MKGVTLKIKSTKRPGLAAHMGMIELYNGTLKALREQDHEQAVVYLPVLTSKLEATCGRGWFKLPTTGSEPLDREIEKANRYLTGRVADLR